MAAEKVETNGVQDNDNATSASPKKGTKATLTKEQEPEQEKEVVALSVHDKAKTGGGVHIIKHSDHLPGGRPVEASHLKVVSTYHSVGGDRPVVASGIEIKGALTISGTRPIAASHLAISETYTVMGNRPVAPNEIDDPATLMGFLD